MNAPEYQPCSHECNGCPECDPGLAGLVSAPKDALAEILAEHRHPGELLTSFGDAWLTCSCGERINLPVRDGKVSGAEAASLFEAHQTVALAEWVAGEKARAWDEGYAESNRDHDGAACNEDPEHYCGMRHTANPYEKDQEVDRG